MKIKQGDEVLVIAGRDKGKSGKVTKNGNDKGGIFDIEAPIHVSNVKKIDNATKTKKESKKK